MSSEQQSRSRRNRPAKPALTKQWIVEVAAQIMRAEGLEKVTMRRVAQQLDTGPASLYVYIPNTVGLHGEILDQVLGGLSLDSDGSWRQQLDRLLGDYTALLFENPGLARSALVTRPTGPNSLRLFDLLMGLLLQAGVSPGQASWGADLLILLVTATAAEHSPSRPDDVESPEEAAASSARLQATVQGLNAESYPALSQHAEVALAGTPAQRSSWAIRSVLAGITATELPNDLSHHS
ncbi:AcrR family transcriptional regulator [Psychromicrobium silvestre]|uniref:AcrR family transcriptional regulator n=1 Tax=Psychromicrobium silvestre TaxID=1645614 RepID=A0A7Y9S8F2_9MICC|nr:TetR/AcrR family transcriptional regulator [Psychromicrobium silvestre]NYE96395.1 AcrR family transcriptional regulator [Psychromicrobium silvestre]